MFQLKEVTGFRHFVKAKIAATSTKTLQLKVFDSSEAFVVFFVNVNFSFVTFRSLKPSKSILSSAI